ncbi:hypothetical protein ACOSQ4_010484 [Xanthoceras sorbifolium]
MSSFNTWSSFGSQRERLKIDPDDITLIEDSLGEEKMHMFAVLKERLQKPWMNASSRVGVGNGSRDGRDGRQSFGGPGNRASMSSTGVAFNDADEIGFKYVGIDGRYVNNGVKASSKEEGGSVLNVGVSGVSKGKSGKGIDDVKGNGKNAAASRERVEKGNYGAKGVNVSSLGCGFRFEIHDSLVEDALTTELIF